MAIRYQWTQRVSGGTVAGTLKGNGASWCVLRVVLVIAVLYMAPSFMWGQGEALNARLTGVVTDPAGAAVPGATLTLVNTQTQATRTFTTTDQGDYTLTFIPAGSYRLKVEKPGFKTVEQTNVILTVGQAATLNVKLNIGQVTEVVQVNESAPTLNTTNANIGSEVNQREVLELPINVRNVFTFVFLDSAVNHMAGHFANGNSPSDQDASFFSFSGRRPGTVAYLLDGHWDGAPSWDAVMYVPSVDETQEFKIQAYSFTSQYGWNQGNVLNAITKSGSERFHGDAFEFIRNSALDANNFFNVKNGVAKTPFKRNQFGFTLGGPMMIPGLLHKGKTFFFVSYEGLRLQSPVTDIDTLPTADMKGGNFSSLLGANIGTDSLGRPILSGQIYDPFSTRAVTAGQVDSVTGRTATASGHIRDPFPGNIIPTGRFDSITKGMLQYWPDPNRPGNDSNFVIGKGIPGTTDRYTVRVDHTISDKSHIFGRWSQAKIWLGSGLADFGESNPAGPGSSQNLNSFDMGTQYVHTFSPTLVLSVNGGWSRWFQGFIPQGLGFKSSSLGLPSYLDTTPIFPGIGIDGVFGLGGGGESATPAETRSLFADITKVRGAHTFGVGFQSVFFPQYETFINAPSFGFDRGMTSGPDPVTTGPSTGFGFASFLLGTGSGGSYDIPAQSSLFKKFFGWYFQDDWKVTRKLTVNLGLRYDFQAAPTERYDRITQFLPNDPNSVLSQEVGFTVPGHLQYVGGAVGRGAYKTDYTNWAPRVGMAYSLTNKLVMRAGFGMFYSPAIQMSAYQGLTLYGYTSSTPWVATVDGITPHDLLDNPFPNGFIQPVGKTNGVMTQIGQNINANTPEQLGKSYRPTPYMRQWMLDFQYAFSPSDTLSVSYVGNAGVDLNFKRYEHNQLTAANQALGDALLDQVPNPFYGAIPAGSACGLDQPTITRGQSLRPWPQYCSVVERQPSGAYSSYNGFMVNYRHDWKQGLHLTGSFTYSKWLSNSTGNEQGTIPGNFWQQDIYHLDRDYSYDTDDIPRSLVFSYVYELPVGHNKRFLGNTNAVVNGILGGWQVAGVSTFKDGFPMAIANAQNNSGALGTFDAQRPNIIGNPKLSNPTPDEWFNTAAFAQPAPYTFGNAPRTIGSIRNMGTNNWDFNIEKWWTTGEDRLKIQFRGELYNAFNRVYLSHIDQFYGSSTFGQAFLAAPGRSIQFALKIYF